MSLFGSNNSNSGGKNNMFRDTDKIISVTNIVTTVVTVNVTDKIEKLHLVYDNMDNLKDMYSMIKNYDKDMDFLNECEFSIFCSFCYDKSNVFKFTSR